MSRFRFFAAAIVTASGLLALPGVALGHHNTIVCVDDGVVSVTNSEGISQTFTTDDAADSPHTGSIGPNGTVLIAYTEPSITVSGVWSNGVTNTVTFTGLCEPTSTTTTVAPTTTIGATTSTSSTPTSTSTSTTEPSTVEPTTSTTPTTTEPPSSTSSPSTTSPDSTTSTPPSSPTTSSAPTTSTPSTTPTSTLPPSVPSTTLPPESSEPTVPPTSPMTTQPSGDCYSGSSTTSNPPATSPTVTPPGAPCEPPSLPATGFSPLLIGIAIWLTALGGILLVLVGRRRWNDTQT